MDTTLTYYKPKSKLYHYTGTLLATISVFLAGTALTFEFIPHSFLNNYGELIALVIFGTILIAPVVITLRAWKRGSLQSLESINITILRYALFTLMLLYATAKLLFGQLHVFYSALDSRLNDVDDMYMVWYFYGRSNVFQLILGLMELVPALLFLGRRTTLLGALIMLPVILNVVMLNVFYRIGGTVIISPLMTFFDLYILYFYKDEIRSFLVSMKHRLPSLGQTPSSLRAARIAKISFVSLIVLYYGFAFIFKLTRKDNQAFKGGYELVALKQNGAQVAADNAAAGYFYKIYFESGKQGSKMQSRAGEEKRVILKFYEKDSIRIAGNLGTYDNTDLDLATAFRASYKLPNENELILNGTQNGNAIEARYKKIPLKEYGSWW